LKCYHFVVHKYDLACTADFRVPASYLKFDNIAYDSGFDPNSRRLKFDLTQPGANETMVDGVGQDMQQNVMNAWQLLLIPILHLIDYQKSFDQTTLVLESFAYLRTGDVSPPSK